MHDREAIRERLREQASREDIRVSIHAYREMAEEGASYDEVREVLEDACVVENYPDQTRGPCCLVCRRTSEGRYLHVVCTTGLQVAVIITVYEPTAPKWVSPFERGKPG
ncbi:MAG: DUF4258 domain-containing protein [Thermodesulfobacteriota bacterium]